MRNSKWTPEQTEDLRRQAEGSQNRSEVFAKVAGQTGRKPNSVRNFYYSRLCKDNKKTFISFTGVQVETLVRQVLLGYSRGQSVRGICLSLAGGDRSEMLRFQNKYRAILKKEQPLIQSIVSQLEAEGYFIKSPLEKVLAQIPISFPQNIIQMPQSQSLSDTDIQNLFMGFVRLVRRNNESKVEKLKEEIKRLQNQEKRKPG